MPTIDSMFLTRLSENLRFALDHEQAFDVLFEALREIGFYRIVFGYSMAGERWRDAGWAPRMAVRGFPRGPEIIGPYDPYYRTAVEAQTVVKWDQVRESYASKIEAVEFFKRSERDLSNGMTVPLHSPSGEFSFLSVIGPRDGERWTHLEQWGTASLPFIASHFDLQLKALRGLDLDKDDIGLSSRELECLAWSALGKTVEEIGIILFISAETVRIYLKRINKKLKAQNRSHAVAKAMALGFKPSRYAFSHSTH
jgi:LuxR family transcriptional regulator